MLNAGARFWIGQHRLGGLTAPLNTNLDMLFNHGINPNPFGGIIGVTYAAWPPPPPPPVVVPAPAEPVVEEKTRAGGRHGRPRRPPPPRPAPRTTTDEIFFDGKSARLTNIAKAVLDGVALRMKNDLNATAVVTGYTDNAGAEQANVGARHKRAEAAKEYLVTRHGIDPSRISTVSKGSAEPAYDNATAEGRAEEPPRRRSSSRSSRERDPEDSVSASPNPLPTRGFFDSGRRRLDAPHSPPPRVVGLTVISIAAVVALLYYGRPLLVPVAFALFLSFALRPFVSLLERAGVPRVARDPADPLRDHRRRRAARHQRDGAAEPVLRRAAPLPDPHPRAR